MPLIEAFVNKIVHQAVAGARGDLIRLTNARPAVRRQEPLRIIDETMSAQEAAAIYAETSEPFPGYELRDHLDPAADRRAPTGSTHSRARTTGRSRSWPGSWSWASEVAQPRRACKTLSPLAVTRSGGPAGGGAPTRERRTSGRSGPGPAAKAEELSNTPGSSWPIGCTPPWRSAGCVSPAQVAALDLARAN